ncbi:hypothetical protein GQ44DRAFT_720124 [Phaeosphaeriaceae sp. PMI808]|nr:hypothetical protein GQ44DRAFT_720124 [Phaeosphaeriaceae sp. PMI808]
MMSTVSSESEQRKSLDVMSNLDADETRFRWATSEMNSAKRSSWRRVMGGMCSCSFFALTISTIAIIISTTVLFRGSISRVRMLNLGDCGSTWQEAERKGCVFDVMAGAWVRAECKEKALSDEYFADGNWTFYRDPEGSQLLPHEELLSGRVPIYYTEGSYDFKSCAYIWHKHVRQMGKPMMLLDSGSRSWDNSFRCMQLLATADTSYINDKTSSKTVVGQTKTGDSVVCIAGSWEPYPKPLGLAMVQL